MMAGRKKMSSAKGWDGSPHLGKPFTEAATKMNLMTTETCPGQLSLLIFDWMIFY